MPLLDHFIDGVLVDIREEPSMMLTYVVEENLEAPEEPYLEQFDHPYVYFLFYGMDGAGDFIACKQLREKYHNYDKEGMGWIIVHLDMNYLSTRKGLQQSR